MKHFLLFLSVILFFSCGNSIKQIKEYNEDGSLKIIYETYKGLKHGKYIEYYPNGNIKVHSNWINDTISGLSIKYYESGNIESTTVWLNGKQHGNFVKFDETGLLTQAKTHQNNKQCGYDMRYIYGFMYQLRHYVLVGDTSCLNQYINYDTYGNICYWSSDFYSIYYYGESDTLLINQKAEMTIILETPSYIDGIPPIKFITSKKWDKYFNIIDNKSIDTIISNNILIDLYASYEKPGFRYGGGILLNPYFDEDNLLQYQKFYIAKPFYVLESLAE